MKIKLDKGAYMPQRAHEDDAGLDLRTPIDVTIPKGKAVKIDTGVHIQLPPKTDGKLECKSGLGDKDILCLFGEIDCGYTGAIKVKLYNFGEEDYTFKAGDKIVQLVIRYIHIPDKLEEVDELDETDRGEKGFGSSGA